MPSDAAYHRERYRRKKEGTWVPKLRPAGSGDGWKQRQTAHRAALLTYLGFAGQCQACGVATDQPVIDHDHLSACHPGSAPGGGLGHYCQGCARGALCHGCNTALGLLADSPDILTALRAYLGGDPYEGPPLREPATPAAPPDQTWEALPGL